IQAAIGQSDTVVTTVQLATYAATLSNNGSRMSTHMIKSIEDYKGDSTIYTTPITALSQLPDINGSYDVVKQGMLMASQEGAAERYLKDLPYTIATKTGTAQVGPLADELYNATIVAYGPTENPEIAIAMVAEKAGNGYYLAETVKDIFAEYYRLKELRKNPNWQAILEQEAIQKEQQEYIEAQAAQEKQQVVQ
ncbi:MAG: penicillin-binding transpeptidase domain-containing protein, partial [Oscillospiraceae bacterium]